MILTSVIQLREKKKKKCQINVNRLFESVWKEDVIIAVVSQLKQLRNWSEAN